MNILWQKTDSIIFDLDGTLWDSVANVAAAWNLGAKKIDASVTLTAEDVRSIMGLTAEGIKEKLFLNHTPTERNRIFEACSNSEKEYLKNHGGQLYPDLATVLKTLSKEKSLFIVSNCGDDYVENFLSYYNLWSYITDFEYYARTKQEKWQNILTVIKRNRLTSPIYVGDTQGDLDAARKAQIPFVFASYGFGTVNQYDASIQTLKDLLTLFA